ncbi:MAG: metal-dependent hydrolase [Leptolyngbya foveolarum]|uniref:Metal-dependent hydrolase n=1 Tax=Leptolyngbya foveolarum TaxID=47253 RepID=A0A2W4TX39_9CYAN|nr:MAG: metal-dependent hydrolase [Leptolyngbya foveolarum]
MKTLKWLGLLIGLPSVAIALFYVWASASTQDPKTYAQTVSYAPGGLNTGAVRYLDQGYTIVSYNIGYLSGLANNTTEKLERSFYDQNQQRAIAAIKSVNPDIVAFQEIDFGSKRSYGVNQVEAIARATQLYNGATVTSWDKNYVPFPYWPPAAHFGKMLSGQAILTHPWFSIQENRRFVLEQVADKPFFYKAFYLDRLAQVTQVTLIDQPVIVINVHLEAFEEQTRVNQTKFVRELAEDYAKTYPVIVVGDFNSALNRPTFVSAEGDTYEETQFSIKEMLASEQLAPAVPPSEWNGKNVTFLADKPEYKLDYMFYTPSTIEVLETSVVTAAGESSDHLPIAMRFRLKE